MVSVRYRVYATCENGHLDEYKEGSEMKIYKKKKSPRRRVREC